MLSSLQDHLDRLSSEFDPWELRVIDATGRRLIEGWVNREFGARQLWYRDQPALQVPFRFGEPGLRHVLKLQGRTVTLVGELPAWTQTGPYKVARLYRAREVDTRAFENTHASPDEFLVGLLLLLLYEPDAAAAVEIDVSTGKRQMLLLPRVAQEPLAGKSHGFAVSEVTDRVEMRVFHDRIKSLLAIAAARAAEGDPSPIPGQQCERCDYGELCRWSSLFGETASPFEELGL